MNDLFIKIILGQFLAFLASTVKNVNSVKKYGKVICTIADGLNSIRQQFACDAPLGDGNGITERRARGRVQFDVERIHEAQRQLSEL